MNNKYTRMLMYLTSLIFSLIFNLEIFNPATMKSLIAATIIQFIGIYIFIAWGKIRRVPTEDEYLKNGEFYAYLAVFLLSSLLGIVIAVSHGHSYCRPINTFLDVLWDRSYVAMKIFSIYPFTKFAGFLYLLLKGKLPKVDYDYFNKNK